MTKALNSFRLIEQTYQFTTYMYFVSIDYQFPTFLLSVFQDESLWKENISSHYYCHNGIYYQGIDHNYIDTPDARLLDFYNFTIYYNRLTVPCNEAYHLAEQVFSVIPISARLIIDNTVYSFPTQYDDRYGNKQEILRSLEYYDSIFGCIKNLPDIIDLIDTELPMTLLD